MGISFLYCKRIAYGACRCNYDRHRSSPECSGNVGQGCDNGILWCYDSCYCIRTGSRSSQSVFTLPDPVMIALVIIAALLTFAALLSYVPNTMQQFKEKKLKKQTKKED